MEVVKNEVGLLPLFIKKIKKLRKSTEYDEFDEVVEWFARGGKFQLETNASNDEYAKTLNAIPALDKILEKYQPNLADNERLFYKEFVLWGMVELKMLDKQKYQERFDFDDTLLSGIRDDFSEN